MQLTVFWDKCGFAVGKSGGREHDPTTQYELLVNMRWVSSR